MSWNHRTTVRQEGRFGRYTYTFRCSCGGFSPPVDSRSRAESLAKQHRDTHTPRR
ncbi:hypothetical protein AB0N07_39595 [Streptomyces sp. NPDC051172]|uniref:hypothetical protein n=1 Tax=Streptomyces sp. NPDC051172 TaxID=3155796 RepID=UPI003441C907